MFLIYRFLAEFRLCCPAVTSIWVIGDRAALTAPGACSPAIWDLVAFADEASLQRVRVRTHLHSHDVRLRIVTAGDRFVLAWGEPLSVGSLSQWDWMQANDGEAFYSEAHWSQPAQKGVVERVRRKALRLWPSSGFPEDGWCTPELRRNGRPTLARGG